jgi:hypothetical protein
VGIQVLMVRWAKQCCKNVWENKCLWKPLLFKTHKFLDLKHLYSVLGCLRLADSVAVELFMQVYLHFTAFRIFFLHTYNYLQQHTVKTAFARGNFQE